jgi:uncharacterized membrane protein
MINFKNSGRIFFGVGIFGIGILHFFYNGFRPIILPVPAESVEHTSGLVYLIAAFIMLSGALIIMGFHTRNVSLLLGLVLFIFFIGGHLPVRIKEGNPYIDMIKIFALSGGAFVMARAFPASSSGSFFNALNKVAGVGKYFFAIMLFLFGLSHLISGEAVSRLVPPYLPWALFWTYLGGIALVGSSLAFIINMKARVTGILLGITLFLWLIMLHLYYAIRFPEFQDGENIIGSFECLAFCGIALVISQLPTPNDIAKKKSADPLATMPQSTANLSN